MRSLIEALAQLPGLGPKSAQRMALALLEGPKDRTKALAELLGKLHAVTVACQSCFMLTERATNGLCHLCRDDRRNAQTLCVVAHSTDIAPIEETGQYHGRYHVLGGVLNPLEGMSAEMLTIAALTERLKNSNPPIQEVILAFDQDIIGNSTVLYIKNLLAPYEQERGLVISRLARGLPNNSTLEYADQVTLGNALKERQRL